MKPITIKILFIFFISILAVLSVIGIYLPYHSRLSKPMGFERNFSGAQYKILEAVDLGYPGYYFSGVHEDYVFLGHKKAPAHILRYDGSNGDTVHYNFDIDSRQFSRLSPEKFKVAICYPNIYFVDGSNGLLIQGHMETKKITDIQYLTWRFDNFNQIDSNSLAFRTYDVNKKQNMLAAINFKGESINSYHPEKQKDGLFDTDGHLFFKNGHLIYLFYYRNKFLVFDEMLTLKYKGTTIDTISKAQIDITSKDKKITLTKPPLRVNKNLFLNKNNIHIESMIKSDNQSLKQFQNQVTIDMYELDKARYLNSFYLPKVENKRPVEYSFHKDRLFAIYENKLVIFIKD